MSEGLASGLPVAEISYYDATVAKRLMEENTNLRRELETLRTPAELAGRCVEALDWLQWAGTYVEGDSHTENPSITGCVCPECYKREENGHAPSCELGQLLTDIQKAKESNAQ